MLFDGRGGFDCGGVDIMRSNHSVFRLFLLLIVYAFAQCSSSSQDRVTEPVAEKNDVVEEKSESEPPRWLVLTTYAYFKTGSTEMTESPVNFDEVYEFIQENSEHNVWITGHADERGDASLNVKLSKERALFVYNKLLDMGVASNRMIVNAMGNDYPSGANTLEAHAHQKNRRVDISVVPQDFPLPVMNSGQSPLVLKAASYNK